MPATVASRDEDEKPVRDDRVVRPRKRGVPKGLSTASSTWTLTSTRSSGSTTRRATRMSAGIIATRHLAKSSGWSSQASPTRSWTCFGGSGPIASSGPLLSRGNCRFSSVSISWVRAASIASLYGGSLFGPPATSASASELPFCALCFRIGFMARAASHERISSGWYSPFKRTAAQLECGERGGSRFLTHSFSSCFGWRVGPAHHGRRPPRSGEGRDDDQ